MCTKIFFGIIIFILFFGCFEPPIEPPTEVPNDFEITYKSGAMHIEWGWNQASIDSAGNATCTTGMGMNLEKTFEFTVTKEEMLPIYQAVVVNQFFSLNDEYEDPSIMDGGWSHITVKANGDTKTVSIINYHNENYSKVASALINLVNSKKECFKYRFIDNCEEQITPCIEALKKECATDDDECIKEQRTCEEWQELCGPFEKEENKITAEYCTPLENRKECLEYCTKNKCKTEICDTLLFEAEECTKCEPGCCEMCTDLYSCTNAGHCDIAWILPQEDAIQFGGCQNPNLCNNTFGEICSYAQNSHEGYAYHATIEQDNEKREIYEEMAQELKNIIEEKCD
jgi:hypothetical protein